MNYADLLTNALDAYMRNDRVAASKLFDVESYRRGNEGKFSTSSPDCSSLLKTTQALLNLVEGLLSGSGEMIAACLDDLWAAEKLANESVYKESIENRISRGCCYLFGGLLQVFLRSYVKSGVNLTIGYKLITDWEKDVLQYSGPNRTMIRSLGLLILALLNFFSLILPPSVTSIGDMLGMTISKKKYNEYIEKCISEEGHFSTIARLIYVYYSVNSKSFMFSKSDPAELKICRDYIAACLAKYPDCLAFRVMDASMYLSESNIDGAVATLSDPKLSAPMTSPEWSTMALAVNYKLGVSHLCNLNLSGARSAFQRAADSVESNTNVMSWNYIPFMRSLEGICYLADCDSHMKEISLSEIRETALTIFAQTYIDRNLASTVSVLPGDLWGARVGYDYACMLTKMSDNELVDFIKHGNPLVDAMYCLATSLYSFEKINPKCISKHLLKRLEKLNSSKKAQVVLGECFRRTSDWGEAVSAFDDAIEITDADVKNGEIDRDNCLAFSLIFQAAALCEDGDIDTAKDVLKDLDSTMNAIANNSNNLFAAVFANIAGKQKPPITADPHHPKPGNIVSDKGNEYELILNFRRNGIRRRIDEIVALKK